MRPIEVDDADSVIAWMRERGVKRLELGILDGKVYGMTFELSDTIPAPPPSFDEPEAPEEEKPPGVCRYKGCGDAANSPIVAGYCRPHALKLAGVGNG